MKVRTLYSVVVVSCLMVLSLSATADQYTQFKKHPTAETAFDYLFQVATYPRCANCHGQLENGKHFPTVGDEMQPHPMSIHSINNLRMSIKDNQIVHTADNPVNCRTCHTDSNGKDPGMPPGAANDLMPGFIWHMPPPTMVIKKDITPIQLCEDWLNPAKNSFLVFRGGRDDMKTFVKEFEHHAHDDPLVRWVWTPGPGRTPAPGTHEDFVNAMNMWLKAGAPCPIE